MEDATTLEEVMAAIEIQSLEDDMRREAESPAPWFELLHRPGRAAWRSTDRVFEKGAADDGREGGVEGTTNKSSSPLSQTQFNLIRRSERTNKQLKRTYKRIMETHRSLAARRERERRNAANLSRPILSTEEDAGEMDGSIEDDRGRSVGSWRDKNKRRSTASSSTISDSAHLCDDPSAALALSVGLYGSKGLNMDIILNGDDDDDGAGDARSARSARRGAPPRRKSKDAVTGGGTKEKPVGYGPEQALTNVRYRFGPNYSIVRRVLLEAQSLLGGAGGSFRPRRVLDFGSGVGSASAAALDVFGVSRIGGGGGVYGSSADAPASDDGIDWIHSVDASRSMRDATERVLRSMLENAPWEAEGDDERSRSEEDRFLEEELAKYERELKGEPSQKALERRRKRMAKWEQTWVRREDARTRLTFGESLVEASSLRSDGEPAARRESKEDGGSRSSSPLPWQKSLDEQRRRVAEKKSSAAAASVGNQKVGTFDLILSSYTLSELPDVPSGLAASALLWEKLAPGGALVFVEPGTPDGFGILRSVRSALLECCPPPELKKKRRRDDGDASEVEELDWPEECHVIAPCTHNGSCPMSRHRRNHVKKNTRFGKYDAAAEPEEGQRTENTDFNEKRDSSDDDEEEEEDDDDDDSLKGLLDDWKEMNREEKDEVRKMLGDGRDMSDEEVVSVLKYMGELEDEGNNGTDSIGEEEDSDSEDDDGDDREFYQGQNEGYYDVGETSVADEGDPSSPSAGKSSTVARRTNVFDASFCSFVHTFPGNMRLKTGEKFAYLVLQKQVPGRGAESNVDRNVSDDGEGSSSGTLEEADVVEMLSESVHHAQKLKMDELRKRLQQKRLDRDGWNDDLGMEVFDTAQHGVRSHEILQRAVEVRDAYMDSTSDGLGLELLHGDGRRKGWGRLIRAPLKRKGHVLLDFCSAGCSGGGCSKKNGSRNRNGDDDDASSLDTHDDVGPLSDGTRGRITRQKVSRGWSARAAPGCYAAARRARWGGLWPDLSERVKLAERDDERAGGGEQKSHR